MPDNSYDEQRERLFDAPCWVIDFLPRQVPKESGQLYFAVEDYLTEHPQIDELYRRFARLLLKLSCYYELCVNCPPDDEWTLDPPPQTLITLAEGCGAGDSTGCLCVLLPSRDAMITLNGGDLYMSLFGASDELLETVRQLASSEGLFLRPSQV